MLGAMLVAMRDTVVSKGNHFCIYRASRLVRKSVNNQVNKLGQML